MSAGYSGTPLSKKLGIAAQAHVVLIDAPQSFPALLDPLPTGVTFGTAFKGSPDLIVAFVQSQKALQSAVDKALACMKRDGALWIAWPKKTSGVKTDVTEDTVRAVALPTGLVDNKVCAIDATWSGLRLVIRRERR